MRNMLLMITAASLATLSLASTAQANEQGGQAAEESQTVRVQRVEMRGKPPYKRNTEVLTVSDAAAAEVTEERAGKTLKGRPPFSRQR